MENRRKTGRYREMLHSGFLEQLANAVLFLCVFLPNFSWAVSPSFSNISVENGLSNNMVNVIFKDSQGFMWFGTLDGLDRFDGVEVRSYGLKFPQSLDNVYALCESDDRTLWVGTGTGLYRYVPSLDVFQEFSMGNGSNSVRSLLSVDPFLLLVGSNTGLFACNTESGKVTRINLLQTDQNSDCVVTDMCMGQDRICWIATNSGLFSYDLTNQKINRFENSTIPSEYGNSFTSIAVKEEVVFLGTANSGLIEFDKKQRRYNRGIDFGHNIITTVELSSNGETLYVGTNGGGLKEISLGSDVINSIENDGRKTTSLSSNAVYSFLIDENDRYWIGTYSGGVCYSHSKSGNLKLFHPVEALAEPFKSIRSFYLSPTGEAYLGTRNGFVVVENEKHQVHTADVHNSQGLRSNIILTVFPYGEAILLGTYGGGISRYSKQTRKIEPFLDKELFKTGNNYAFEKDHSGNLWIASFNGLYQYIDKTGELIQYNKQNSPLINNEIFELMLDSKGRLWVGTMHGVAAFIEKDRKLISLNLPKGMPNEFKVNNIYEDEQENVWVCTERGGMYKLNQSLADFQHFDVNTGLPDNSVCAIVQSKSNEYWVSTLRGFCSFHPDKGGVKQYTLSDGLPSLVFNPAAIFESKDKTLWFGNEKGLMYFSPNEMNSKYSTSNIKFTDLYLFGKPVQVGTKSVLNEPLAATSQVIISQRQNSVGFRFVNLNYINAADNHYWVKLDGYDTDWRDNGSNTTVFYDKLKPGRYTFRVKSELSEEGAPLRNEAELKIVVKRSLTRSPIFIIVLLVLVGEAIFLLFNYVKSLNTVMRRLTEKPEKYKGSKLTDDKGGEIIDVLRQHMDEHKPYLNPELKLADLASDIGISTHEISQVLNQSLNQGFADFVNKYRLDAFVQLVRNGEHEHLTLFAIAQKCGFNSKTSFYRIFKIEFGMTPAQYQKQVQSDK